MIWQSWSDFFAMGGYGSYVWGSVGATFALLLGEIAALRVRRRTALRALIQRGESA
ncbi:MAG TPA: heme exporter protein CcmD [Telluria sp.]|jgi:heme exporter protein D